MVTIQKQKNVEKLIYEQKMVSEKMPSDVRVTESYKNDADKLLPHEASVRACPRIMLAAPKSGSGKLFWPADCLKSFAAAV